MSVNGIHPLWTKIRDNMKLRQMENAGFQKGEERGKTTEDTTYWDLIKSLGKQMNDFDCAPTKEKKLQALADIRNVAGLLFDYIEEFELP